MISELRYLLLFLAFSLPAAAADPLRVLAIGDSLTEEYAFELPFSAPASDPTNANARNWPELFRIFRPTELSLGPYESTPGSYLDLRIAGHEWNFGIYNVPAKQLTTRAKIAAFNQSIITWAAGKNRPPTIARLDLLTDRIFDEVPFHLNGTVFTLSGSEENPPLQVFCRDGFHVSTVGQALIANELMAALGTATGRGFTRFSNREILRNLLGRNPDQPYLDWIAAAGLSGSGMDEDPDKDGFPNLAEYLLDSSPGTFGHPLTGRFAPGQSLGWQPSATALRFGSLTAEESTDLSFWSPVPAGRITLATDGSVSVTPAPGTRGFARLRATPNP